MLTVVDWGRFGVVFVPMRTSVEVFSFKKLFENHEFRSCWQPGWEEHCYAGKELIIQCYRCGSELQYYQQSPTLCESDVAFAAGLIELLSQLSPRIYSDLMSSTSDPLLLCPLWNNNSHCWLFRCQCFFPLTACLWDLSLITFKHQEAFLFPIWHNLFVHVIHLASKFNFFSPFVIVYYFWHIWLK